MTHRQGFLEYLESKKITPNFLSDFAALVGSLHKRYNVLLPEEDFYSQALFKVLTTLPDFDPSKGKIQNYIYTMIRNEASNANSRESHYVSTEMDYERQSEEATPSKVFSVQEDYEIREGVHNFYLKAFKLGIVVDQLQLYTRIFSGEYTAMSKVFYWENHKPELDPSVVAHDVVGFLKKQGLSDESAIAIYYLLGDNCYIIAELLKGHTLKFNKGLTASKPGADVRVLDVDGRYPVMESKGGYKLMYPSDIELGDVVRIQDKDLEIIKAPVYVFNSCVVQVRDFIGDNK